MQPVVSIAHNILGSRIRINIEIYRYIHMSYVKNIDQEISNEKSAE